jgi:hypothetical protein
MTTLVMMILLDYYYDVLRVAHPTKIFVKTATMSILGPGPDRVHARLRHNPAAYRATSRLLPRSRARIARRYHQVSAWTP